MWIWTIPEVVSVCITTRTKFSVVRKQNIDTGDVFDQLINNDIAEFNSSTQFVLEVIPGITEFYRNGIFVFMKLSLSMIGPNMQLIFDLSTFHFNIGFTHPTLSIQFCFFIQYAIRPILFIMTIQSLKWVFSNGTGSYL